MTETGALQSTLETEHAALYVFGALIGRLAPTAPAGLGAALRSAYAEHRTRRDELTALVRAGGEEPVAAAPAYRLPTPLATAAQVRNAAVAAERTATEAYAALVASSTEESRSWAVSALTASAVRQLTLGGPPDAFPGAPELG